MSVTSSSSFPRASSKNPLRKCPKCPHRLVDFHQHETTPEPELQPNINKIIAEETEHAASNTYAAAGSTAQVEWSAMSFTTGNEHPPPNPGTCPETCACPNIATKAAEHTKTKQAEAWLETKAGRDHLRICIPSCPYKLLKAELEAVTRGEEVKRADAASKKRAEEGQMKVTAVANNLTDNLTICVASCPYRKTAKETPGEASMIAAG